MVILKFKNGCKCLLHPLKLSCYDKIGFSNMKRSILGVSMVKIVIIVMEFNMWFERCLNYMMIFFNDTLMSTLQMIS
jgi:hypothetical protein